MLQLDHVIIAVEDLEAGIRRYEAILGCPVALRSDHPRGTRNALFLFERGPYLELLATWDAPEQGTSAAALRRRLAERGEGLHGLGLSLDNLDACVTHLRGLGLDLLDPVNNSAKSAGGRVREWRATRMPPPDDQDVFLVQHLGSDWRAELRPTPGRGTVASMHHVAFDVPDAGRSARRWQERLGLDVERTVTSERMAARVIILSAGEASLEFVEPLRADGPVAQRMAQRGSGLSSLAFEVRDLNAAVDSARDAGVRAGDPEPGVLPNSRVARLDAADACGVAAQFVQFEG